MSDTDTAAMPGAPAPGSARNSALVAGGILLSRISGLVRTAVIARFFGVGAVADALQAALRIPNLLQNLLGEGVLSASFIPVYSRLLAQGRPDEAGRVAGAVLGLLTALAGGLALLGVVLAEPITQVIAIGFTGDRLRLTVTLVRVLFPGVGFLVLSAWCLGVLNSHRHFFLSYVAPVIWNLTQIVVLLTFGLVILGGRLASEATRADALAELAIALAWGAFAGGVLQFGIQLPSVIRVTRSLRPSLDTSLEGVRRTLRSFWPVVAGRGVVQIMTYVDVALASLLATGAVAAMEYSNRLVLLPISLFGMSVAASELPELSALETDEPADLGRRLSPGLARIAFYVAPTVMAFVLLGDLIIGAVLQGREFGPLATQLVWLVLVASSVGLLANTSARLLQSALYAMGDTRTPARIAALRVMVAALLGAGLMLQFDRIELTTDGLALVGSLPAFTPLPVAERMAVSGISELRLGAVGLALAAGTSAWLELAMLRAALWRRSGIKARVGGGTMPRIAIAALVAASVAIASRMLLAGWVTVAATLVALGLSGTAYLIAARILGLEEVTQMGRLLARRRRRGFRGGPPQQ